MSPQVIPILIALAQAIPAVAKLLEKRDGKALGEKVVEIAQTITRGSQASEIVAELETNAVRRQQFEQALLTLETSLIRTAAQDREGARHRDTLLVQRVGGNLRADIMVVSAALGLVGCLVSLVFFQSRLPGEAIGIISTIAGIFGACLKDAYAFEFGSSRGSKNKDEHVAALLRRYEEEKV